MPKTIKVKLSNGKFAKAPLPEGLDEEEVRAFAAKVKRQAEASIASPETERAEGPPPPVAPVSGPAGTALQFGTEVFGEALRRLLEGGQAIREQAPALDINFANATDLFPGFDPQPNAPLQFPAARDVQRVLEFATAGRVKFVGPSAKALARMGSALGDAALTGAVERSQGGEFLTGAGVGLLGAGVSRGVRNLFQFSHESLPRRAIMSILKPSEKNMRFGKDPVKAVLQEGIFANTRRGMLAALIKRRRMIGAMMDEKLAPLEGKKFVDLKPVFDVIEEKIKASTKIGGDPELTKRLLRFQQGILHNWDIRNGKLIPVGPVQRIISPLEAQALRKRVAKAVTWTPEAVEKGVMDVRSSIVSVLGQTLEKTAPGLSRLNSRYANILSAEKSMETVMRQAENKELVGVGLPELGIGSVFGLFSGSILKGVSAFLGFKAIRGGLQSVPFKIGAARLARDIDPATAALMPEALTDTILGLGILREDQSLQPGERVQIR